MVKPRASVAKQSPKVGIVVASPSDLPMMEEALRILDDMGIPYEVAVTSAHRTPKRTRQYIKGIERKGIRVIIAGAGGAAHLAGVLAAETTLPVIGVPLNSSPLSGLDALLSTVQMPGGVPVATMAVGKAGAKNAGVFAAEILALSDKKLSNKLRGYKIKLEEIYK